MTTPRRSKVVYVLARLFLDGRDYFLLREHRKWGDWSLVGGHVEPSEESDWTSAARRETEEEMQPLRIGADMEIVPLPDGPELWGPERSVSAGGTPTVYCAKWYALRFLHDPTHCFGLLPAERFLLVERARIESNEDADLTSLFDRLCAGLPRGLDAIPYAWPPDERLSFPPLPRRDAAGGGRRASSN